MERQIYIRQSGVLHASAQGECSFDSANDSRESLTYFERGKLSLGAEPSEIPFTRKFLYQFEVTGRMKVFFGDGPDIGKLYQVYQFQSPDKWVAEGVHLCGNDKYEGIYEFYDVNAFSLTTAIGGPNKDFLILTNFRRR